MNRYKLVLHSRLAEVQTITINSTFVQLHSGSVGGTFKITMDGTNLNAPVATTPCIAWDADASVLRDALLTQEFTFGSPSVEKIEKSLNEKLYESRSGK